MLDLLISLWCHFVIAVFGPSIDDELLDLMTRYPKRDRLVLIYPHTSKLESFWFLLYFLAYRVPSHGLCYYTFFDIWSVGAVLKHIRAIPVRPLRFGGSGGTVKQLTRYLRDLVEDDGGFVFAISPEGSLSPHPWQSGYYWLARETGAEIRIMGLDYRYHHFVLHKERYSPDVTIDELQPKLMEKISEIVPLYPDQAVPRVYTEDHTSYLDWNKLSLYLMCAISLYVSPHNWIWIAAWCAFSRFYSERCKRYHIKLKKAFRYHARIERIICIVNLMCYLVCQM